MMGLGLGSVAAACGAVAYRQARSLSRRRGVATRFASLLRDGVAPAPAGSGPAAALEQDRYTRKAGGESGGSMPIR